MCEAVLCDRQARDLASFSGTVSQNDVCVADHKTKGRRTLSVQAEVTKINSPPDSPMGLAALRSTASRSTRICLSLVSPVPVVVVIVFGHSGNRSC